MTISGFTIKGGYPGILNSYSSATVQGNFITGNFDSGITDSNSSSSSIIENIITGNAVHGIFVLNWSSPKIARNDITGNGGIGVLIANFASPTITENTITGNSNQGVYIAYSSSKIIHNIIVNNGGTTYPDIFVESNSTPNISFNIYDDITGATGVGQYNVNSNGDPAPMP